MSEKIIITNPAPIVVQVKGGTTTAISAPSGRATKLVELSDVNTANLADGKVLTYVSANGDFEFLPQASATATDQVARDLANAAQLEANLAYTLANTANDAAANALFYATDATLTATLAFLHAAGAFDQSNAAFDQANGAIYTAAQIRANISNTTPINYSSITGVISHADSGVTPTTYGNTTFVPTITVDAKGHVTSITNTAIALPPSFDQFARDTANGAFTKANVATTNADAAFAQANAAYNKANTANVTGQAAFDKANTAIYTAAQIRANLSNTAPINYDPSTGIISHALSGVTASGYGDAATVAKVVVDSNGHVTSVTNTSIAISATQVTSGTLVVGRGGTGQTAASLVNGAVLIGNTVSGGYDLNPITPGTNITVLNDKGSITISSSDGFAQAQANAAFAKANIATTNADAAFARANAAYANANTAIYTATQIRANISNTTPILYDPATGIISLTTVPVSKGGTGQTAITVNGSLLIGNTVSGGFDVNPLTQGTGIVITNDKGSITIAATGGSAIDQYARDKANGAAQNSFITINVAGQANVVADSNTDTLTLVAGSNIVITTDAPNDTITIASTASGSSGNSFTTINVAGQNNVVADSNNDTLVLVGGNGIAITTDAPNDTITIAVTANGAVANGDWDFISALQPVTAGLTVISVPHGFAGSPTSYEADLVAVADTGEGLFGWAIGEFVQAKGNYHSSTYALNYMGADTANVYFFISATGGNLIVPTKSTGNPNVLGTLTNWNIRIKANYRPVGMNGFSSIDLYARNKANGAAQNSFVTVNVAGQSDVVADSNVDTLILVAGTGIAITTDAPNDTITIAATGGSSIDQFARDHSNGAFDKANGAIYTAAQIRANISNTTPILYDPATGIISLTTVPVSKGGTGQTAITVNGSLLIGNTVSGGYDVNPLTAGIGVVITNDKGSISIAATSGGAIDQFARDKANLAFNLAIALS